MYRLENVTKTYRAHGKDVTALADVSLEIADGEWLAVTGPTGGGKSTLLQMLGALDRPELGEVEFGSGDARVRLDRLPERSLSDVRARRIGFVFQSFNLIPTLSAHDNVAAALRPLGVRGEEATTRAQASLASVGLASRAEHLPGMLSGGQQQRVAIARALVKEPDVLLADEPTGNLDERMRNDIVALFAKVHAARGVTVVMVTHDSRVAARAGRVIHLEDGRLEDAA